MRMQPQPKCLRIYTLRRYLRFYIQDERLFFLEPDLESNFYRWYVRLVYAMTMSTFCSPLKQILRYEFADFDEDSDIEDKVILLLGEAINFLLQLSKHNFQATVIKIKSSRESIQGPRKGLILLSSHYTLHPLTKRHGLLGMAELVFQYERTYFCPVLRAESTESPRVWYNNQE